MIKKRTRRIATGYIRVIFGKIRMNSGGLRVARGSSGAKAPPLAAHPFVVDLRGSGVTTVHDVCDLACILGLTCPKNSSLLNYQGS